ncbi:LOW QUALITY PROTEIN: uncharacterized protein WCC33_009371 [Rhinophrynus dorsalis]
MSQGLVDFKYKAAFSIQNSHDLSWSCGSGNCGSEVPYSYLPVDNNTNFQSWYQYEGYMVRHLTSDKPFYLIASSCCWATNYNGNSNSQGSWSLQTFVDLGTRSDTSKPNNSPVTTMIPVFRVPSNCSSSFKLLAHDPDGDTVRCRYGNLSSGECATCYRPPQFTLDQNSCILSYSSSLPVYTYAFELVLEDFPNQNISLKYNDGTVDKPTAASAVTENNTAGSYAPPMLTSAAPTCTYGEYRPKFLPPTPNQGETVVARAGSPLQIYLSAQATYNSITDFKVSGPSQLSKVFTSSYGSSTRSMLVQWTSSENDVGDHVPFCFVAETETEDYIVFSNRVTSFHNTTDVITRNHQFAIPFNCSFPKKHRLSNAFRPQTGFGNFTYKFQFYTDEQFIDIQTQYPLEVWLRDELYMEIQVTSSVPNVQLFVESCRATPHDDPNDPIFYDIILDGCVKDETVVVYPGTRTRARFGMEAFAFIGNYEEVYLSCTVLCKLGKPNTHCTRGCINSSLLNANQLRSRRSLTSESQQHFISQGPLRSNKTQSLNVNTLVVSLSGVANVALIALIMHNCTKKSRIANYETLPTQDF